MLSDGEEVSACPFLRQTTLFVSGPRTVSPPCGRTPAVGVCVISRSFLVLSCVAIETAVDTRKVVFNLILRFNIILVRSSK